MTTLAAPCRVSSRPSSAGLFDELIVDAFAGGGGASLGIEAATGRAVDVAINHDHHAIEMHTINHPHTAHLRADIWSIDPAAAVGDRPVRLLWASPDCRHFSAAKGGRPVSTSVRALAWVVVKWAKAVRPRVIILENVREFETWGPLVGDRPCPERRGEEFAKWVRALESLGYRVERRILNAADYGAPTCRRRLFIIARRDGAPIVWPEPTHAPRDKAASMGLQPWRAAAEVIDWSLPVHSIFLSPEQARAVGVRRPLADATLRRIAEGVRRYVVEAAEPFLVCTGYGERPGQVPRTMSLRDPLGTVVAGGGKHALVSAFLAGRGGPVYAGKPKPVTEPFGTLLAENHRALCVAFLVKYYGQGCGQGVREPLGTATVRDRFGLVNVLGVAHEIVDIGLRMLTPRELARAQGFPDTYRLTGTKTQQTARIGNSVSPVVAKAIVRANLMESDQ